MSLYDCPKCWDIICSCGYEYETWQEKRIQELVNVLQLELNRRASGGQRRRDASEPDPNRKAVQAGDYSRSIAIPAEAIEQATRCHPECPPADEIVGPCHSCKVGAVRADGDGTFTCLKCGLDIHGPWWPNQCKATDVGLRCVKDASHQGGHFYDYPGEFNSLSK